ncbi:HNH endonuclease [Candidatus Stoquefichus sp. SB1]|uniref:HNH endonuclease n=1 Tax=Candidatus Stoquefichus sp. SB1 TaxID=1658109 RepID=UPI00067E9EEA|nr:HNH endonuclease [Candidatus Stoquefichus sp. SB1]
MSKKWGKDEIAKLKKLYPYYKNNDLSILFRRSVSSIQHKATCLKLKKDDDAMYLIRSKNKQNENCNFWNGGRKQIKKGYIMILDKLHPKADINGYVMEHRVIVEKSIGRYLKDDEVVHHINGIKNDNRIENLKIMKFGEHTRFHNIERKKRHDK